VRMTKPISHHLTTGTFNYVVKDPNCFRLSGQLWIKDLPGRSRICVLELDGAVLNRRGLPMAPTETRADSRTCCLSSRSNSHPA